LAPSKHAESFEGRLQAFGWQSHDVVVAALNPFANAFAVLMRV